MARRRQGTGRATPPGADHHDPLRPRRPTWVRVVVVLMLLALVLSVVGGFVGALAGGL